MPLPREFGQSPTKNSKFGRGNYLQNLPPGATPITYDDFRGGFDARMLDEGIPKNASPSCKDVQITESGRLKRLPGTSVVVNHAGKPAKQMLLHASLSGSSEMIFFSAPFIGVHRMGVTTWTDIGLLARPNPVAHAQFGDDLIFAAGAGDPYIRPSGGAAVPAPTIPSANAYAVFAGRVYAGGAVIDGKYEPMGVQWSDLSGNPRNWTGEGGNSELLLDNLFTGDRIVAMRTMGFGMMAILCRSSVWVATFTGDPERPADFQPRGAGGGTVHPETARATNRGVIYLSGDGVRLFDGNQSTVISDRINKFLLPGGVLPVGDYSAMYDLRKNRYYLFTPTETWIYELTFDRWLRSSMLTHSAVMFAEQIAGTLWSALVGDWSTLMQTTWTDLSDRETDVLTIHYLRDDLPTAADSTLHKEDANTETYFGVAMTPTWQTPRAPGFAIDQLMEYKQILVEWLGVGAFDVRVPDKNKTFVTYRGGVYLDSVGFLKTGRLSAVVSGMGAALDISLGGTVEIAQLQLHAAPLSQRVAHGLTNMVAVGGVITDVGGYRYHTFLADGNFQIISGAGAIDFLIIGGGGGGGWGTTVTANGGGGAGGFIEEFNVPVSGPIVLPVVVGLGGISNGNQGNNGADSSFNGRVALGGGGGSRADANRGSGGGGTSSNAFGTSNGGPGTAPQGFKGGDGCFGGVFAGGGGGAEQEGGGCGTGTGGRGKMSVIDNRRYAGGGGGGGGGAGGEGGGAAGTGGGSHALPPEANTGSGGGGTRASGWNGSAGARGRVVIRYKLIQGIAA